MRNIKKNPAFLLITLTVFLLVSFLFVGAQEKEKKTEEKKDVSTQKQEKEQIEVTSEAPLVETKADRKKFQEELNYLTFSYEASKKQIGNFEALLANYKDTLNGIAKEQIELRKAIKELGDLVTKLQNKIDEIEKKRK